MNSRMQSEHFTLQPLADGVYAAIATELGAGFSNAGLVDLGDQTLVFDAFENPQAAEDLLQASLQLTGRRPATVIISHWHPDHWAGLQVFAGSHILSTDDTRQAMIPLASEMLEDREDPSRTKQALQETETRLENETDPAKRHTLQVSIARQRHGLQALPTLAPTLPNHTFAGKIFFHGTRLFAELIPTGKGHTISDCILRLPQQRVAFIGDIGFFQAQPFMPYGYPTEWVALLKGMSTWDIDTFVPGHGPVGTKTDLALEASYILALEELVQGVVQAGGSVEDALRQTLPPPFDAWQAVGQRFEANVRSAYKRQSSG
ncbi:MAG TPA: MBL fold metallo-hydrolase [Anaerolineales bacterium]|nr:MBL fold metallo-hydrolase [Anaerolineales bacterium]